jgi:hypothetical protein
LANVLLPFGFWLLITTLSSLLLINSWTKSWCLNWTFFHTKLDLVVCLHLKACITLWKEIEGQRFKTQTMFCIHDRPLLYSTVLVYSAVIGKKLTYPPLELRGNTRSFIIYII